MIVFKGNLQTLKNFRLKNKICMSYIFCPKSKNAIYGIIGRGALQKSHLVVFAVQTLIFKILSRKCAKKYIKTFFNKKLYLWFLLSENCKPLKTFVEIKIKLIYRKVFFLSTRLIFK